MLCSCHLLVVVWYLLVYGGGDCLIALTGNLDLFVCTRTHKYIVHKQ